MPHTTIEYSANVADHHDIDALVETVHATMIELGLAGVGAHRTRAVERVRYRIGDGTPEYAFVAITVRLGPGRSPETKQEVITRVLDAAESRLATEGDRLLIAWSMEVQEIDARFRENRNHVTERPPVESEETAR